MSHPGLLNSVSPFDDAFSPPLHFSLSLSISLSLHLSFYLSLPLNLNLSLPPLALLVPTAHFPPVLARPPRIVYLHSSLRSEVASLSLSRSLVMPWIRVHYPQKF
ncbi:unnamed protein product [Protopolystoma xenopodis]|uniref:Uncharacterized protein n=1 Tax=Protopolystoma xenopodis TaxID=117903 RepID=A0A448WCJ9_9PLAT|nr:unnamed protein product [Protopolystoma xenopodis]